MWGRLWRCGRAEACSLSSSLMVLADIHTAGQFQATVLFVLVTHLFCHSVCINIMIILHLFVLYVFITQYNNVLQL